MTSPAINDDVAKIASQIQGEVLRIEADGNLSESHAERLSRIFALCVSLQTLAGASPCKGVK